MFVYSSIMYTAINGTRLNMSQYQRLPAVMSRGKRDVVKMSFNLVGTMNLRVGTCAILKDRQPVKLSMQSNCLN